MNIDTSIWNFILNGDQNLESESWRSSSKTSKSLHFYVINNPDGTARWIFPVKNSEPLFLKFYPTSTLRSKGIKTVFRLLYFFGLIRLIAKKVTVYINDTSPYFEQWLSCMAHEAQFAIFTGTVGPNRKILLYQKVDGNGRFIKVPLGKNAAYLVNNEKEVLAKINTQAPSSFYYPEVIENKLLTLKEMQLGNSVFHWSECHQAVINTFYSWGKQTQIHNHGVYEAALNTTEPTNKLLLLRLKMELLKVSEEVASKNLLIKRGFGHGDFTSWNTGLHKGKLNVIDWELAGDYPLLYDTFHFIIQNNIMLSPGNTKGLIKQLITQMESTEMIAICNSHSISWRNQLSAYLLEVGKYYHAVYTEQKVLHYQAEFAIRCWVELLEWSFFLIKGASYREVFIKDIFQELTDKSYALMKNEGVLIEDLNESSDLDILIKKENAVELVQWIEKNKHVSSVSKTVTSYMMVVTVFFNDGSFVSIDFIYKLKRRWWEYLKIDEVIEEIRVNKQGVKIPKVHHDLQYMVLFYFLNHSCIPLRYKSYFTNETERRQRSVLLNLKYKLKFSASTYEELFDPQKVAKISNQLYRHVKRSTSNKLFNGFINKVAYAIDVLKLSVKGKGMVITFSGVDGAGKSTVIEHIKNTLEKKFRKRVVVLRHRPSLFPILSAWVVGKQEAERQAATRLPRQGRNKSFISSLFRFSYYLLDFLFGQGVIWFKYTLKGDVVLYDRYYFDFIEDPKRSNVILPRWYCKMFYRIIYKPHVNVFLHADPDLILARKPELSKEEIIELTGRYKGLFSEYSKRFKQRYIAIENEDLQSTLTHIETLFVNAA